MGRANAARAVKKYPLPLKAAKIHSPSHLGGHLGPVLLFVFSSNFFWNECTGRPWRYVGSIPGHPNKALLQLKKSLQTVNVGEHV